MTSGPPGGSGGTFPADGHLVAFANRQKPPFGGRKTRKNGCFWEEKRSCQENVIKIDFKKT